MSLFSTFFAFTHDTKYFSIAFLFPFSSFPFSELGFCSFVAVTSSRPTLWTHWQIAVSRLWNLVIDSNGGFKWKHVESCFPTTANILSSLPQWLWLLNLADLPWEAPTHMISWPFSYVVLLGHVTVLKHISTTRALIAAKLGRIVTYLDVILPLKLIGPLVTWSYQINWQIPPTIISRLSQCLLPSIVTSWLPWRAPTNKASWLLIHMNLQDHMMN